MIVMLFLQLGVCLVRAQEHLTFSYVGDSVNVTICQRVLTEAYNQLGVEFSLKKYPSKRAFELSSHGELDGELFRMAHAEKQYLTLVPVPTPINVMSATAFSKRRDVQIEGWESLKPYRVGVPFGIILTDMAMQGMQRVAVGILPELIDMLENDGVEVVVLPYTLGLTQLAQAEAKTQNKSKIREIDALHPPVAVYPLYHYLNQKHQQWVPKLDDVLQKMAQQGRIAQIREEELNKLRAEL
jgi:polar amino acid transport system substrate-binding protein